MPKTLWLMTAAAGLLMLAACGKKGQEGPVVEQTFPCDNLQQVVSPEYVSLDKTTSADGKGSIKITASQPTTIKLFNIKYPGKNSKFTFDIKMKTENFSGQAYLKMDILYEGGGHASIQNYQDALMGDSGGWVPESISYTVPQKPYAIEISAVLNGTGTVWFDDGKLIRQSLKSN
ncbi:MAG: hypothetical protein P8Z49_09210 [Acidobacteriota bacterium]|jgi:predicted small lipoprotein YifL